jgi:hypothetical protein
LAAAKLPGRTRETFAGPNRDIATRLDEVARIFAEQGANRFRVQAYRHAANVLRRCPRSVAEIFAEEGIEGLEEIPGIGASIARAIRDMLLHGRLAMLDRLRGEGDPVAILASVPVSGKYSRRDCTMTSGSKRSRNWKSRPTTAGWKAIPASVRNIPAAFAIRSPSACAAFAGNWPRLRRAHLPSPSCSMSTGNTAKNRRWNPDDSCAPPLQSGR